MQLQLSMGSGRWEALDLGSTVWSYRRLIGRTLESIVEV